MAKPLKILFLQHAGSPGGSNMSLLFTLQGLNPMLYKPTVGLVFPSSALRHFYEESGFPSVDAAKVSVFRHTTAGWGQLSRPRSLLEFLRNYLSWRSGGRAVLELIAEEKPSMVHLNSVILAPVAAMLLRHEIPFVWHVREAPVHGYFGFRYQMLRRLLLRAGERVIFISKADKQAWVGGACGTVVHNFVDFKQFNPELIGFELPTILYLGGFAEIKGVFVLLEALRRLRAQGLRLRCRMPGCLGGYRSDGFRERIRGFASSIGLKDTAARALKFIERHQLGSVCELMPYEENVPALLAVSDLLVFPSTQPHFARPVIEAAAMGKPSVASNLDGVSELVDSGKTGLLVPARDPRALAKAIATLLEDKNQRQRIGEAAHVFARSRFDSVAQVKKMMNVYNNLLAQKN
jgi:glycosyltransferase involved in cell wall biosynthesis